MQGDGSTPGSDQVSRTKAPGRRSGNMGDVCEDLVSFADGELEEAAAGELRFHLRRCGACRIDLVDVVQLSARLSTLDERPPGVKNFLERVLPAVFVLLICALVLSPTCGV